MGDELEETEVLEEAVISMKKKYGYSEVTVCLASTSDWSCAIGYENGKGGAGAGSTLREALSAASVEALNNHPRNEE